MSQLFRRYKMRDVGTSAQDAPDGTDFDTFDTSNQCRLVKWQCG